MDVRLDVAPEALKMIFRENAAFGEASSAISKPKVDELTASFFPAWIFEGKLHLETFGKMSCLTQKCVNPRSSRSCVSRINHVQSMKIARCVWKKFTITCVSTPYVTPTNAPILAHKEF